MEKKILRNGMEIPSVGLGTWQITDREVMAELLHKAYETGYRLIDTAAAYSNEIAVGKAMADLPREEILLSDKVWNTFRGYEAVQEACRKSLKKCKTDYFDLYLIHWPASPKLYPNWEEINADTWRGMEQLYKDGLVKSIGVCNFYEHHLEALKKTAEIMPFVDQFEMHPGMPQKELCAYCAKEHIVMEASSPLGNGQILTNPVLQEIAEAHGKTVAAVCLRYGIQAGAVVLPKTAKPDRLLDNFALFDFSLTEEEIGRIEAIPYCGGIGLHPDEVVEFG